MRLVSKAVVGGALGLCFLFSGCDADKLINKYYAKLGLTQLAIPRDDLRPARLVLVKEGREAFDDGSIYPLLDDIPSQQPRPFQDDVTNEFRAVLRDYTGDRGIDPVGALSLLSRLIPVKIGGKLKFTSNVVVDLVNARAEKVEVSDLRKLLNSRSAASLRKDLEWYQEQNLKTYITYEVYWTNKLKITAADGAEIAPEISIGDVGDVSLPSDGGDESGSSGSSSDVSIKSSLVAAARPATKTTAKSGEGQKDEDSAEGTEKDESEDSSFWYKKTDKSTLLIAGTKEYAFAVRTALIVLDGNAVRIDRTNFAFPKDWGIKSLGTDHAYSALPVGTLQDEDGTAEEVSPPVVLKPFPARPSLFR